MRSDFGDFTTRARIRDAALALFGARGYAASSVRAIAAQAGVSAALIIHHFGTKEALRAVCDEYIVDEIMGRKSSLGASGDLSRTIGRWLDDSEAKRPQLDYLARMIVEGGDAGARLFSDLVDRTETMIAIEGEAGRMHTSSDPRMTATIVAAHGLMPLLLEQQLGRALGEPGLTSQLISRMTIPTLELYTHGLYATTDTLQAAAAALSGKKRDPASRTKSQQTPAQRTDGSGD